MGYLVAWEVIEMGIMEFQFAGRPQARWVVRLGIRLGAYLDKEQALLDAVEAARGAAPAAMRRSGSMNGTIPPGSSSRLSGRRAYPR